MNTWFAEAHGLGLVGQPASRFRPGRPGLVLQMCMLLPVVAPPHVNAAVKANAKAKEDVKIQCVGSCVQGSVQRRCSD
jgi:hypothetical protein